MQHSFKTSLSKEAQFIKEKRHLPVLKQLNKELASEYKVKLDHKTYKEYYGNSKEEKEKNKLLTKRLDCVEKQLEVQLSNTVRAAKISDENIQLKKQIDKQFHEIELIKNKLKEIIG